MAAIAALWVQLRWECERGFACSPRLCACAILCLGITVVTEVAQVGGTADFKRSGPERKCVWFECPAHPGRGAWRERLRQCMFPDPEYAPAGAAEQPVDLTVAAAVAEDLLPPEGGGDEERETSET